MNDKTEIQLMPKLSAAEEPLMDYIWQHGKITASDLAAFAENHPRLAWKRNTTYTVITRLQNRGVLKRLDVPGYWVEPLWKRANHLEQKVRDLATESFDGSLADLKIFIERLMLQDHM